MVNIKNRGLLLGLFVFFCIHSATHAVSTTVEGIALRSTDEKGNLLGAPDRGYLDIREVRLTTRGENLILLLTVEEAFPNPELMLGTGFRFDINFKSFPILPDATLPLRYQLRLALDAKGWQFGLYQNEDTTTPIETDLILETGNRTLSVTIPDSVIESIREIEITATTQHYPKWTPVTTHPPISLTLSEPPQKSLR